MAAEIIRSASIFYKGRKHGLATGGTLEVSANFEDQIADGGWVGTTTGPKTSKVTLNCIVPYPGTGFTITADMLRNQYADVGVGIVDGKYCLIKNMKCSSVRYEWDNTRGSQTMTADFSGGEPEFVG